MRTIVEYGLANAAAATALAMLALIVGTLVRRPAVRNALWVLVFVRLLLPPIWSIDLPMPAATDETGSENVPLTTSILAGKFERPTTPTNGPTIDEEWNEGGGAGVEAVSETSAPSTDSVQPTIALNERSWLLPEEMFLVGATIWLAGSALVFTRSARNVVRFHRALRDATVAPLAIQRQAESLSRTIGLRRCPEILLVPGRLWPSLWMPGLFPGHAKLILPAGLLPLLSGEQRAAVLAHELAHLRRGDPWVRWLELIACGIYWWHPLLGWFRRQLRESEEECCDLRVVAATGGRKPYATALVETAAYLNGPDQSPALALASRAGPVRNLQRRVTMIMRTSRPAQLTRLGLATVLGIGGLGLAFGPALAQDRKDQPPREERRGDPGPKDRPDGPPRERDRERGGNKEIDEARAAVEKARQFAHEAMMRLQEAEARLAKLEGRSLPPARKMGEEPRRGGGDRGPDNRGPADRGGGDRGPGERKPVERGPEGPPMGRGPGIAPGRGELQELHQQIEELRRALEEMRRELRKNNEGRGPDRPKDGKEPRRGNGDRGGNERPPADDGRSSNFELPRR
jgi:beta-lactamase regulating signal transducer with metallopeptidase domain